MRACAYKGCTSVASQTVRTPRGTLDCCLSHEAVLREAGGGADRHVGDGGMIRHALAIARRGVPVFPLHTPRDGACSCGAADCGRNAGKHPRTRRGLNDASTDLATIRDWWRRWPDAGIGLATGPRAGLWVLDVDVGTPAGPWIWEMGQGNPLPRTRFCRTGGGGRHWYWRLDADVLAWLDAHGLDLPSRNAANGLKGRDVKAAGGYVVAPPSLHRSGDRYEWLDQRPMEHAPEWLLLECARPREVVPAYTPRAPGHDGSRDARYGAAVLARRCAAIAASSGDQRHDTIRAQARIVGGFVGAGWIDHEEAQEALVAAGLATGRPPREVRRTVAWGLVNGAARPVR